MASTARSCPTPSTGTQTSSMRQLKSSNQAVKLLPAYSGSRVRSVSHAITPATIANTPAAKMYFRFFISLRTNSAPAPNINIHSIRPLHRGEMQLLWDIYRIRRPDHNHQPKALFNTTHFRVTLVWRRIVDPSKRHRPMKRQIDRGGEMRRRKSEAALFVIAAREPLARVDGFAVRQMEGGSLFRRRLRQHPQRPLPQLFRINVPLQSCSRSGNIHVFVKPKRAN